jgi:hypothetical protein
VSLLTVLRFIGLIDASGTPSETWEKYRGAHYGKLLASAIRQGYSDPFAVYPDANARTATEIEHVISTTSSAGKQAITKTVRTFQNLSAEADFTAAGNVALLSGPGTVDAPAVTTVGAVYTDPAISVTPSLHIDRQVHISPDSSPSKSIRSSRVWKCIYTNKEVG